MLIEIKPEATGLSALAACALWENPGKFCRNW